jgi:two-component system sensor histidine kinase RegB
MPGELNVHLVGMWLAYSLVALITAYCISRITGELRESIQETAALKLNQQRLASLTNLAAGAAHELGTPLGTAIIALQELRRRASTLRLDDAFNSDLALMESQIARCKQIIAKMGGCSGEVQGEMLVEVSLREFVRDLEHSLRENFGEQVSLEADVGSSSARLPTNAIKQAVLALAKNAVEASPEEELVRVRASSAENDLQLLVSDHGTGMSAETLARVGEPFFSTKGPTGGMGLGVFLARLTAESIGGNFILKSSLGEGTSAQMSIPRS